MSALISRIQQKKTFWKNIEKCGFYKGKTKNGARPFRHLGSVVLMKNRKSEGLSISTMVLIKKMSVLAQLPFLWLTVSITSPPLKKRVYKRVCNYHRFLVWGFSMIIWPYWTICCQQLTLFCRRFVHSFFIWGRP